jgi:hypothetical protein
MRKRFLKLIDLKEFEMAENWQETVSTYFNQLSLLNTKLNENQ